jgi:pimeloyl-ACP methyl ester carboxylesterase
VNQIVRHRAVARSVPLPHGRVAVLEVTPPAGVPVRGTALLVPGYTGSKEDFAPVLDPLAEHGWRVAAMDQPGQYESAGPDEPASYTVDWLASVVLAVRTRLEAGGPVHLLGHSFGGLVARAAALVDPAGWRSVTLLGSGPSAIGGPRKDRMAALEPLLAAGGMPAAYEGVERLARLDPRWTASPPELKEFLKRRFLASTAAGLTGMGAALLSEPDRVDALHASGLPLLVAHGEHDDAWQPETQRLMAKRLDAAYEVIADSVHSPAVERPAATVAVLHRFWSSIE